MATERGGIESRGEATGSDAATPEPNLEFPITSGDETLVQDENSRKNNTVLLSDWSQTGRGSHVDFSYDEKVPIEQGHFLGRGAVGDVHEVTIQGWKLAHKKMVIRRKLGGQEKKEIEILKRLPSHHHIIQLIGTYTYRQILGILLYPVAVCDLHTFFEDVEAWSTVKAELNTYEESLAALDATHKNRLIALGYDFPGTDARCNASPIYSKMGCLISAISYLHDQKIRHKDLKPSNILLSKDRLWLSDFGSATDFSLLSQSATDNERGTPRYFSPEVAAWKSNGRAADVFSLGCVLLEIVVLHERGTLDHIRRQRSGDPSFHANLSAVDAWCTPFRPPRSVRRSRVMQEISSMLVKDASIRPTARQLLVRTTGYDLAEVIISKHSIFGNCCKSLFISTEQREADMLSNKSKIEHLQIDLQRTRTKLDEEQQKISDLIEQCRAADERLVKEKGCTETYKTHAENMEIELAQLKFLHSKQLHNEAQLLEDKIKQIYNEWDIERQCVVHRIAVLEKNQVQLQSTDTVPLKTQRSSMAKYPSRSRNPTNVRKTSTREEDAPWYPRKSPVQVEADMRSPRIKTLSRDYYDSSPSSHKQSRAQIAQRTSKDIHNMYSYGSGTLKHEAGNDEAPQSRVTNLESDEKYHNPTQAYQGRRATTDEKSHSRGETRSAHKIRQNKPAFTALESPPPPGRGYELSDKDMDPTGYDGESEGDGEKRRPKHRSKKRVTASRRQSQPLPSESLEVLTDYDGESESEGERTRPKHRNKKSTTAYRRELQPSSIESPHVPNSKHVRRTQKNTGVRIKNETLEQAPVTRELSNPIHLSEGYVQSAMRKLKARYLPRVE